MRDRGPRGIVRRGSEAEEAKNVVGWSHARPSFFISRRLAVITLVFRYASALARVVELGLEYVMKGTIGPSDAQLLRDGMFPSNPSHSPPHAAG